MAKGLFLCIEGGDGSGKTTQHALLAEQLRREGQALETVDFPQYGTFSAELATAYLNNEFGPATELDPRLASLLFAVDRFAAKERIATALERGAFVLANRFTASNMAHQAAKITDTSKHTDFFHWVYKLEHDTLGIPEPDHHFLLHIPAEVAQQRVLKKAKETRTYTPLALDGHEADLEYQKQAEQRYLELAATFPDKFTVIEGTEGIHEKTPAEIHTEIWNYVTQILK